MDHIKLKAGELLQITFSSECFKKHDPKTGWIHIPVDDPDVEFKVIKNKANKSKTAKVFKNSDGYLTEDEDIHKRREKVLRKYKKLEKQKAKDKDSFGLNSVMKRFDLRKAERTNAQIKEDKIQDKIRAEWDKNKCKSCNGKGEHEESDYCGRYTSGCSDCSGTGYNKEFMELQKK